MLSEFDQRTIQQVATPYPGLRPFRHDEAEIFFGREQQTDQLLERLQRSHFLAVVGPSGCGKSSLVRAGLIPDLQAGFLSNAGAGWRIAVLRPSDRPLEGLASALLEAAALGPERGNDSSEAAIVLAMLRRGPLGLIEILQETHLPPNEKLLLLVDQFEEIFRFREQGNADEADAFVQLLLASSAQRELAVYVVITMRSDFLGECALFTGLPEAINDSQYLTPRLSREQIRAAIVGPTKVFGARVEPGLVNTLLNEVGPDPDQLPLLQHALMRTWKQFHGRVDCATAERDAAHKVADATVLAGDYEAVGQIDSALSRHADQVFKGLSERQQEIAQVMLCRLTERQVGKRDIRRPARIDDISRVAGVEVQEVIEVADVLRQQDCSFLMPPPPIQLQAATVLDIGHESLIRQWHRLDAWIESESLSAATYRRLVETARLWDDRRAVMLSRPELDDAVQWRKKRAPNRDWACRYGSEADFDLVMRFLRANEEHAKALEAQQLAAAQAQIAQEKREQALAQRAKLSRYKGAAAVVLGLLLAVAVVSAFKAQASKEQAVAALTTTQKLQKELDRRNKEELRNTEKQLTEANKQKVLEQELRRSADQFSKELQSMVIATRAEQLVPTDPGLGMLLALQALQVAPTTPAWAALEEALRGNEFPDKKEIFTSKDADHPYNILGISARGRAAVAWIGDGLKLSAAIQSLDGDSKPYLIPVASGGSPWTAITMSPDGHFLSVKDSPTSLVLWDIESRRRVAGPLRLDDKPANVRFSPLGDLLIATDENDGKLWVWETRTWSPLPPTGMSLQTDSPNVLALSSEHLVVAREDKAVVVVKVRTGEEVLNLGDSAALLQAVLNPQSTDLLTIDSKHETVLWDLTSKPRVVWSTRDEIPRKGMLFSPDGTWFVTWAADRLAPVEARSVSSPEPAFTLQSGMPRQQQMRVTSAQFSQDGRALLLSNPSGAVRIWRDIGSVGDLKSQTPVMPEYLQQGIARTTQFVPDLQGRWIISTCNDGIVRLGNALTGKLVARFAGSKMTYIWPTPDGHRFLTSSVDQRGQVWQVPDLGSEVAVQGRSDSAAQRPNLDLTNPGYQSVFSANGGYLLAYDSNARRLGVWNAATGELRATLAETPRKAYLDLPGVRAIMTNSESASDSAPEGSPTSVWNVPNGMLLSATPSDEINQNAAFAGSSHFWTWQKGVVKFWGMRPGTAKYLYQVPIDKDATCIAVSPDEKWLVTCMSEKHQYSQGEQSAYTYLVVPRCLPSCKPGPGLRGHSEPIRGVVFSRDGKYAVSISDDHTAIIWQVNAGWRRVGKLEGHNAGIKYASFSPDSRILVTGYDTDYTSRAWDTSTGSQLSELRGHTGSVLALAYSPDSHWLVTGSSDYTARVWDLQTGSSVAEFHGSSGPVIGVMFVPGTTHVRTVSADGSLRTYACELCVDHRKMQQMAQRLLTQSGRVN